MLLIDYYSLLNKILKLNFIQPINLSELKQKEKEDEILCKIKNIKSEVR